MVKRTTNGSFWPKCGVYNDLIGVAQYFIGKFGAKWQEHEVSRSFGEDSKRNSL